MNYIEIAFASSTALTCIIFFALFSYISRLKERIRCLRYLYLEMSDWAAETLDEVSEYLKWGVETAEGGPIDMTKSDIDSCHKRLTKEWIKKNGFAAQHMAELNMNWFGGADRRYLLTSRSDAAAIERGLQQKKRVIRMLRDHSLTQE